MVSAVSTWKPDVDGIDSSASLSGASAAMQSVGAVLTWLVLIQLTIVVGWVSGHSMVGIAVWIALVVVGLALLSLKGLAGLKVLGCSVLVVTACGLLALLSHDFSSDGQTYHQEAIAGIASGWNPLREGEYPGAYSLWISHYSAGPWLLSASIYKSTGNIEVGKGLTYVLMAGVGVTAYALAKACACQSRWVRLSFALLMAFNPICCCQIQTYFIDGQVGSLFTLVTLLAALACLQPRRSTLLALAAACVLTINAKLSSLPMLVILLLCVAAGLWLMGRRKEVRVLFAPCAAGTLLGLCIGFHPYGSNWIDHGHPFYPLAGQGKVNILTGHVSPEFQARNRFEKLAMSIGSASEYRHVDEVGGDARQFRWKVPFAVFPSEIRAFYKSTGMCVGGFGPWTSGALLVVALGWIVLLARGWRPDPAQRLLLVLAGGLSVSVLAMPECWWARYAPQGWTTLVLLICVPLMQKRPPRARLLDAALLVALCDVVLVLVPALANRFVSEMDWNAQAASLVSISRDAPLQVLLTARSTRIRLQDAGVRYVEPSVLHCDGTTDLLIGTSATVCIPQDKTRLYLRGSPWIAHALGRSL